jgi:hypothetical protein
MASDIGAHPAFSGWIGFDAGQNGKVGSRPIATSWRTLVSETPSPPKLDQPLTDDSIKVRQVSHYQFSWMPGAPGEDGVYTLQLVLDQGAWEEVLTLTPDDADALQDMLSGSETVMYDVGRRVLMFGTVAVGEG